MGVLRFLVWTGCAVGLGIFLARGEVGGRTPLEHMERAWKRNVQPSKVERLKQGLGEALDEAKQAVGTSKGGAPRERITEEDRAAINRIIAQKK